MSAALSGPMFEPSGSKYFESEFKKHGAHYNIFAIKGESIDALKAVFPEGEANEFNICLFSTSGIHGMYTTIEEIEKSLIAYGDDWPDDETQPDDYRDTLTVLIIQPRIVCLRYGNVKVRLADIPYLKKLRESSAEQFSKIGHERI